MHPAQPKKRHKLRSKYGKGVLAPSSDRPSPEVQKEGMPQQAADSALDHITPINDESPDVLSNDSLPPYPSPPQTASQAASESETFSNSSFSTPSPLARLPGRLPLADQHTHRAHHNAKLRIRQSTYAGVGVRKTKDHVARALLKDKDVTIELLSFEHRVLQAEIVAAAAQAESKTLRETMRANEAETKIRVLQAEQAATARANEQISQLRIELKASQDREEQTSRKLETTQADLQHSKQETQKVKQEAAQAKQEAASAYARRAWASGKRVVIAVGSRAALGVGQRLLVQRGMRVVHWAMRR